MEFLGFTVDTRRKELSLPAEKLKKIRAESRKQMGAEQVTGRTLSRLIGKMNAANQVIPPAPLFYRSLQMELSAALREADQDYETTIMLLEDSKKELVWWDTEMVKWNGRTILAQEPHMVIESDASKLGWGASCQGISTGGPWSAQEKSQHINCLELLAATLALQTFVKNEREVSVLLKIDNTAAVAYINNQGGTVSKDLVSLTRKLDVVPGEEYSHTGTAPPWCHESNSRCRIESNEGSVRLEIGSTGIPEDQQCLWTTGSRSLCIPTDQSVLPLLQLAARSISRGHGCVLPELGGNEGVCQPPLEPNISCISENTDSRSRPDPGGSRMEGTTMVCSATVNVGGLATPAASTVNPHLGINPHTTQTGRVEHLRERLHGQGLSGQATELILESWRTKTNKSYDSLFGRWSRWCGERGSDPFSGPVTEVANFLATLYQEGYQYNSVNAYGSAISSVHEKVEGVVIGQHPIITRLLKGIYNVRPPLPRYNGTWNVQTALNHLESLGETKNLTLKLLTMKTVPAGDHTPLEIS